jgi:hypothetical protein
LYDPYAVKVETEFNLDPHARKGRRKVRCVVPWVLEWFDILVGCVAYDERKTLLSNSCLGKSEYGNEKSEKEFNHGLPNSNLRDALKPGKQNLWYVLGRISSASYDLTVDP